MLGKRWWLIALLVALLPGGASAAGSPVRLARMPALSPDGRQIVFAWHGDLWIVASDGGEARKLAALPGYETRPRWSPDGQWIAFSSTRNGNNDLYTIPAAGGQPTQITFHSADDLLGDWSPDGKELYFSSSRESRNARLYAIRLADGRLREITVDEIALDWPAASADGRWLAYQRGTPRYWRKGYRGSANAEIYLLPLKRPGATPRRLTRFDGNDFWPLFGSNGDGIYYVTDRDGQFNLWQMPITGGPGRPVTRHRSDAVRFPTISHDRRTLVYECDFSLWRVDLRSGGTPVPIPITATDPPTGNPTNTYTITGGAAEYEIAPDGSRVAIVARGEIFVLPASGGEAIRIHPCPARDGSPAWSPDGRLLAFTCENQVNVDVCVIDVETRESRRLTRAIAPETNPEFSPDGQWVSYLVGPGGRALCIVPVVGGRERVIAQGPGITGYSWSPDSRWLAYTRRDLASTIDIWIVPRDGSRAPANVTRCPGSNTQPRWTADGRRLVFLSTRESGAGNTAEIWSLALQRNAPADPPSGLVEVTIDFDRIERRARRHTDQPGISKSTFLLTPDGKTCLFPIQALGQSELWSVPLDGGAPTRALTGVAGTLRLTADGTTLFALNNGRLQKRPRTGGDPVTIAYTARMEVDVAEERRQTFDEGWRLLRDTFYDERMHGVDWNAVRQRYRPLVDECATREELHQLMNEMIGELNASHLGTSAGGAGPPGRPGGGPPAENRRGTAYLGFWFDYAHAGPGLKVTAILRDGPADTEGSRLAPGQYVLAIDGKEVTASESLFQLLDGKAGRSVELLVNDRPTNEGARTLRLTPLSRGQWSDLFYEHWVATCRAEVARLSGGRLAYMHLRAMDQTSLRRFERELLSDAYWKEGLVLDVRWNGGGNIHDQLLSLLTRTIHSRVVPRGSQETTSMPAAFRKPIILLINQSSGSDAEIFPYAFRFAGLGKLVGVTTYGGVIGTRDVTLIDGATRFRTPFVGWYTIAGENLENLGVAPDIVVENRPEDAIAGRDRQLETATRELLKQIDGRRSRNR